MTYTWLIDKKFFNDRGLLYSKDIKIGNGHFVNDDNVRKYTEGYYKVSMFVSLLAVKRTNYSSILRRKVMELFFLNNQLYYTNHDLFIEVIKNINDLMRVSRNLFVRSDIGQFIDNVLDAVNWQVKLEDVARLKFFKPVPGVYDFAEQYEESIERYRADVAIFNNHLRSMETANRLLEAIMELGNDGFWVSDATLSDMTFHLFGDRISASYIPKVISRFGFAKLIADYNVKNHGTTNEKTKATIDVIIKAALKLREKGDVVSKANLAKEADMHLQTIYYQFSKVDSLEQNINV